MNHNNRNNNNNIPAWPPVEPEGRLDGQPGAGRFEPRRRRDNDAEVLCCSLVYFSWGLVLLCFLVEVLCRSTFRSPRHLLGARNLLGLRPRRRQVGEDATARDSLHGLSIKSTLSRSST